MIGTSADTLLERYQLVQKLGKGASSTVYAAVDRSSGERVAIKELAHVNPQTIGRFKHEFRAMQEVHHPNLVRLDGLFHDKQKWFIAMELVDGTDLLSHLYVDHQDSSFDETQLRAVFLQLATGLEALHRAGFVHRDLKPHNILVTATGRVVVLDFGLAIAIDPSRRTAQAAGMGTLAYMAPEQAEQPVVGPAADWYAFGVCLYQAMTGVLPIDADTAPALLRAKRESLAPPASQVAFGIPADLDELCCALLEIAPSARPSGPIVRSVLQGAALPSLSPAPAPAPRLSERPTVGFEGREHELDRLERAFVAAQQGTLQVVLIEGESGIGKSALTERFLATKQQALRLHSRCYENELIAYKAFDGATEELAEYLGQLPDAECADLLPLRAALLCRLFPALEAVSAIAQASRSGLAADPGTQRLDAFATFAALLTRLGRRSPVVLSIDDLQWADLESFRLLMACIEAQPGSCLILATVRPESELEGEAAEAIATLRTLECVHELRLTGLSRQSAMALSRELMSPSIPASWLENIVTESGGHPLFLTLLSRFAESHNHATGAELTLDVAIRTRLDCLPRPLRSLLETVAVAESPLSAQLCGRAAGLIDSDVRQYTAELCRQGLLRLRRAGQIACFHDRIRHVTLACLTPEQATAAHGRLAATLATHADADAARLAHHYEVAEAFALAHASYKAAAEKAAASLAFARAAALYERALHTAATLSLSTELRVALLCARAQALARSGRSAAAAQQFLEAAQSACGEQRIWLRIWAAQHLLQSARVQEGMAAASALLDELGTPMPLTPLGALARIRWERARARLQGLEMARSPVAIAPRIRMRLEALWGLAVPVAWLDPLKSGALIARHLRLAQRLSQPTHMSLALAEQAFIRQYRDPHHPDVDALLRSARSLCESVNDPALEVRVAFREASIAYVRWDLSRALERSTHAHAVATQSCPDQPWLLTNVRINLSGVYTSMGRHALLATATGSWRAEARERGDRFALSLIPGTLPQLMNDDPDSARASVAESLAPWPREPFSFAHYGEMISVVHAELYRGGEGSHRWLERELPRCSRAFMIKGKFGQANWLTYRTCALLAARNVASDEQAQRLLRSARLNHRTLGALDSRAARCSAASLAAQLCALDGNIDEALAKTRQAREQCATCEAGFLQHTLEYFEGVLEGGDAGLHKKRASLAYFVAEGWKKPRRAVSILCPVVDALDA